MSDKPLIVFLNGPKEVGKTSLATALMRKFHSQALVVAHADPIAWATQELFYSGDMHAPLKDAAVKAGPIPGFDHVRFSEKFGDRIEGRPYTVRDWMIAMGRFIRKELGPDALSRILLRRMIENEGFINLFIVEGCRTKEDIETITEHYGADRIIVARLHREGHTFEGDLGYYINPEDYPTVDFIDLHNNGLLEDVVDKMVEKINARL